RDKDVLRYFLFFFFKQKTGYEMATRLEFRRVLFRSLVCPRRARTGTDEGPMSETRRKLPRFVRRRACPTAPPKSPIIIGTAVLRSEERRVGKECRSRWWA